MLSRHAVAKLVMASTALDSQDTKNLHGIDDRVSRVSSKRRKKAQSAVLAKTSKAESEPRILPRLRWPNVVIESIGECCVEFIHLIVAEANDVSRKQQEMKARLKKRKRDQSRSLQHNILPDHLFDALRSLGFEKFMSMAEEASNQIEAHKVDKREKKRKRKNIASAQESEALKSEQKRLFAQAALKFSKHYRDSILRGTPK